MLPSVIVNAHPLVQFRRWLDDAVTARLPEPTAASLATADRAGRPNVRMVLVKTVDERGFVFYTNLESPKALELKENPQAALCFYWNPPGRQVRVNGRVEPVSAGEADAYFASRPLQSRLGAWASKQSRPLTEFAELERAVAAAAIRFAGEGSVPRPPHWSGFLLIPSEIEEAGTLDGATPFQQVIHILLPNLKPTLLFIFIVSSSSAIKLFTELYVLIPGVPMSNKTLVAYLYRISFERFDFGFGSALAVIIFIITSIFSYANFRMMEQRS